MAKYTWIQWFKPSTSTWYYGIPEKQIEFVEQKSYDGVLWTAEISVREFDSNDVIWYQKLENAGNDCPSCGAKRESIEKKLKDGKLSKPPSREEILKRLRDAGLPTNV